MGEDEFCPSGAEITLEEDCKAAIDYADELGITDTKRKLVVHAVDNIPSGCSYKVAGNKQFHFNYMDGIDDSKSYRMVCKQGKATSKAYFLSIQGCYYFINQ